MKFLFNANKESILVSIISVVILIAVIFILFFFDYSMSSWALNYRALAGNEERALGEFFQIVRLFGKADVLILLAIVLGLAGRRRRCKQIIIALILVGIMVHPIKNIVGRERPDHSSHTSFPSGDTATAFILPEIFTASSTSVVASSIVAAGVGISRVFYQKHYPSDVVAGALVGLIAGFLGVLISNRIKWLPTRQQLLIALFVFSLYLALAGIIDAHHRHNLQFIVWYFPALLLYLIRPYLAVKFSERSRGVISGKLYYYIKNSLTGCYVLGVLAIVLPWLSGAAGLRAPAFSFGIALIIYAHYAKKELKSLRLSAFMALSATLMFIGQFWILGYLIGKF